ncbi:uncharacterized protein UV8b_04439 [Ustilaginoidea virens]|uniref:Uncharacterized protein n=1 Tax=Ustilaginoidea virens TaxID=1159556 RepID=A0A8E5HRS6_USTVR|nr:uncharacterized protein UV8b_04439 [Ustilaginoidea virens]QUC20198.1 hypothetical protein UV8b_04439 [Ustilaginoidea virens]
MSYNPQAKIGQDGPNRAKSCQSGPSDRCTATSRHRQTVNGQRLARETCIEHRFVRRPRFRLLSDLVYCGSHPGGLDTWTNQRLTRTTNNARPTTHQPL